jgi:hypothetical protein
MENAKAINKMRRILERFPISVRKLQTALACKAALLVACVARHTALLPPCPARQISPHLPHTDRKSAIGRLICGHRPSLTIEREIYCLNSICGKLHFSRAIRAMHFSINAAYFAKTSFSLITPLCRAGEGGKTCKLVGMIVASLVVKR